MEIFSTVNAHVRYAAELNKGRKHALKKSFWSGFFGGMFFQILLAYLACGLL